MLVFNFPLIKEAEIQVGNLVVAEVLSTLLGAVLWLAGRHLWRMSSALKRAGGAVMLLALGILVLGWLTLNGLVLGSALGLV